MKPALFFSPYIDSYPVLMLLGFVFGWLIARWRAPLYCVRRQDLDNIGLLLPIAGVFGARFFARLFYAKLPILDALQVWKGDGLVFYGGFVFGVGTVIAYGAFRRINLPALCDCVAPSVATGLAFGRVGCFLAGCCWGDVCVEPASLQALSPSVLRQVQTFPALSSASWPIAVQFPAGSEAQKQHIKLGLVSDKADSSLPVHPVQMYEAVLAAALCVVICRFFKGNHAPGSASLALLAGYAIIRFGTEYFRADNKLYAFGLTFSQVVSTEILVFCLAALGFRFSRTHSRKTTVRTAEQSQS